MEAVKNIYRFYRDGFARMGRLGRTLWLLILLKLIVMFLVLRVFFFRDYLSGRFDTEEQKTQYVVRALTGRNG